jgi:hypothetical protein
MSHARKSHERHRANHRRRKHSQSHDSSDHAIWFPVCARTKTEVNLLLRLWGLCANWCIARSPKSEKSVQFGPLCRCGPEPPDASVAESRSGTRGGPAAKSAQPASDPSSSKTQLPTGTLSYDPSPWRASHSRRDLPASRFSTDIPAALRSLCWDRSPASAAVDLVTIGRSW